MGNQRHVGWIWLELAILVSLFGFVIGLLPDTHMERADATFCSPKLYASETPPGLTDIPPSSPALSGPVKLSKQPKSQQFVISLAGCPDPVQVISLDLFWFKHLALYPMDERGSPGPALPRHGRQASRAIAFALPAQTTYLLLEALPAQASVLHVSAWSETSFLQSTQNTRLYYTGLFAAFLTLTLVNTLVFLRSRDRDYARYLPFLYSNLLFLFLSEGVYRLIPGWSLGVAHWYLWTAAALTVFFANRFIIRFSGIAAYYPRISRYLLRYPAWLALASVPLTLLHQSLGSGILQLTSLWLSVATMGALGMMLFNRRGGYPAEYLFTAWASVCLAVGIRVLYGLGLVELNALVIYGVAIASLFETLLLSMALGYKMVELKNRELDQYKRATTDELTQLPNRRALKEIGQTLFNECRDKDSRLVVALIDLDHFKRINDTHGHAIGDAVLQIVGRKLKGALRQQDLLGRYGGEEFLCLMPATEQSAAEYVMTRLIQNLGSEPISVDKIPVRVTFSVGITSVLSTDHHLDDAIGRADKALYEAKHQGRARVAVLA
ncbi:sensor domain-containing diguanylate cyclase [Bowmanella dokdonensis]|uniref:diguanylate cyclase n=1 Tax=Bowmanella dokdonensis TaxID=751969 RepID=A0A939DQI7_9ALTE|nr:diguanylate cyclase [Bowmanella dokdonensis]MBN7826940.1 diguanylate cyclase [Bowmanella dokdonensis]